MCLERHHGEVRSRLVIQEQIKIDFQCKALTLETNKFFLGLQGKSLISYPANLHAIESCQTNLPNSKK